MKKRKSICSFSFPQIINFNRPLFLFYLVEQKTSEIEDHYWFAFYDWTQKLIVDYENQPAHCPWPYDLVLVKNKLCQLVYHLGFDLQDLADFGYDDESILWELKLASKKA